MFLQLAFIAAVGLLFLVNNQDRSSIEQVSYVGNIGTPSSVDEISTMRVAAKVARKTNLVVANNVANLSDTISARDEFVSETSQYATVPTIVRTDIKTIDDATTHEVADGESLSDIAAKYGVKTDTIRWANDIQGTIVPAGRELTIPPVDGVYYEVADGDTLDSVAEEFDGNATRIVAFNGIEDEKLKTGAKIMIPDGKISESVILTPTTVAEQTDSSIVTNPNYQPSYAAYNGYAFGNCTWHAANRRTQVGKPIPNNLGNAATWASLASSAGFSVSGTPQQYDVVYHKNIWISGGYGHVAFVEKVNDDGSLLVSDMNYVGFNVVSNRTVTPSEFNEYLFIH